MLHCFVWGVKMAKWNRSAPLGWAYAAFGALSLAAALWLGSTREIEGSGWGLWAMSVAGLAALARAWLAWPRREGAPPSGGGR